MPKNPSANPAEAAKRAAKMLERLKKMRSDKSISGKLLAKYLPRISEQFGEEIREDAPDAMINVALLRHSEINPGQFTVAFPSLKSLTASQKIDFANNGVMPATGLRRKK